MNVRDCPANYYEERPRSGEILRGKYLLAEVIGAGGMGCVYRAENLFTGRVVAVKVAHDNLSGDVHILANFRREARAATLVRHPNIVDVLDADLDDHGVPFIVEELLQGEHLAQYLARSGGRLRVTEAVELLLPIVDAMAFAHEKGVVHRDLKPGNVFLVREASDVLPKVLDFGIAQLPPWPLDPDEDLDRVVGTPGYMAPEQVLGGTLVDARADVWSLGVMLYELVAGQSPFGGSHTQSRLLNLCFGTPTPLNHLIAGVSPMLVSILSKCLQRRPADRFAQASDLASSLRQLHWADEDTGVRPTPLLQLTGVVEEAITSRFHRHSAAR